MIGQSSDITYLAETNHRNKRVRFGIREHDRLSHMYVIGKTGTGKSTLLRNMAVQDMDRGKGLALLDPHGSLVEDVRRAVPRWRENDLVYLDVPDSSKSWFFNPVENVPQDQQALAASHLVETFKKIWPDGWGARLEHLLRNVAFTLLELPGTTLADIPRLLTDKDFRAFRVRELKNPAVKDFWRDEFARFTYGMRGVVVAPLQNKVGAFLTDPLLRRIFSGKKSSFNLRDVMDGRKILLVNLSKGQIGEGAARLLGSLLVGTLSLAALGRATSSRQQPNFFVYLDEFQSFATVSLATMMAELRKFGVGAVLAHQYLAQLDTEIRDAVLGNVGTLISFRVGALDAPLIAKHLAPKFEAEDVMGLPNFEIYLRLLIDGMPSRAFSAKSLHRTAELRQASS